MNRTLSMSGQASGDNPALYIDGNLVYKVLTVDLLQEALDVIVEGFADEPCSIHIEPDREERRRQASIFATAGSSDCSSNGVSVVCVDSTTGAVAGVFYARDFLSPPPQMLDITQLPTVAPCVELVAKLESEYTQIRPGLKFGDCLDLLQLAVHPNYRKRGIATTLTTSAISLASSKGYRYVILQSSGGYSAKCAATAGMRSIVQKVYGEHYSCLEGIPEEHSCMQLWEYEVA